jgi:hypothetical protein
MTVANALTLTNGTLNIGTNTLTLNSSTTKTSGTLTSSATGTVNYNQNIAGQAVLSGTYGNLIFSDYNKTLSSSGLINISGIFTPGSASGHTLTGSTIVYNGSSPQTLPLGFTTYNNLTLNNTSGTTGFAGLTVNGTIRVQAGNFTSASTYNNVQIDDGASLTAADDITVNGNWTNNGSSTPGTYKVTFSGTATQTIGGTTTPAAFNNMTISNAGGVTLLNNTTTAALDIATGALTVSAGKSLTATGNTTLNSVQCLVLKSDAGGTASFIDNGTISGIGTAKIERYLTKFNVQATPEDWKFHFLSSPVGTAQAIMPVFQTMTNDTSDFYLWDEPTGIWINTKLGTGTPFTWNTAFGEGNGAFVAGQGYLVAYPSDVTNNFTGKPYTSSTGLTMPCTNNTAGDGWNLLGNPFPSAIDWDLVAKGAGMDEALYYYDNGPPRYRYYVALTGGIGNSYDGGSRYIPAMQGFMVHAKSSTSDPKTITIDNGDRVHESLTTYYKDAPLTDNVLNIRVEGNNSRDDARVCFYDLATVNFDGEYDAYKLFSYNTTIPELYSLTPDNTQVAINTLPLSQMSGTVPVGFMPGTEGVFTLTADGIDSFTSTTDFFLEDLKNGYVQKLNYNPVYTFNSTPGDDVNRFLLRFGPVGINDPSVTQTFNTWYNNGVLYLKAEKGITSMDIFNVQGQNLLNHQFQGSNLQRITLNLPVGVYIARLMNDGKMQTVKIIVQ